MLRMVVVGIPREVASFPRAPFVLRKGLSVFYLRPTPRALSIRREI